MDSHPKQGGSKAAGASADKTSTQGSHLKAPGRKASISTISSQQGVVPGVERRKEKHKGQHGEGGSKAHSPAASQNSLDTYKSGNTAEMLGLALIKAQKKKAEEQQPDRGQGKVEPTYRMEPVVEKKFSTAKIRPLVVEIVQKYVSDIEGYNPKTSRLLAVGLAELVKQRLKDLKFDRYKIVVMVHMAELKLGANDMEIASLFLGDPKTDNYIFIEHKNSKKGICAGVLVFGIYHD